MDIRHEASRTGRAAFEIAEGALGFLMFELAFATGQMSYNAAVTGAETGDAIPGAWDTLNTLDSGVAFLGLASLCLHYTQRARDAFPQHNNNR